MPYDYIYEPEEYSGPDEYTPNYDYPSEYVWHYPEPRHGLRWVLTNFQIFVIFPAVMILNLLLFIATVRNERGRCEPWRWLIAHNAFVIFLHVILSFLSDLTYHYGLPSLITTPLCPAVTVASSIMLDMIIISTTLIAIERFRALLLSKGDEGGMGKKAVILSLALFWLLLVIVHCIPVAVEPAIAGVPSFDYFHMGPGVNFCYTTRLMILAVSKLVFFFFVYITIPVVIIGTIVLACKKTTTPEMKQSIVVPTLTFTVLFYVFSLGLEFIVVVDPMLADFIWRYSNRDIWFVLQFLTVLSWISFPIIWLVTWSRNGDIMWKKTCSCCQQGDAEEKRHLLEPK